MAVAFYLLGYKLGFFCVKCDMIVVEKRIEVEDLGASNLS